MAGTDPSARVTDAYLGMTLADRYLIRRRVGSGGMGNVYEAEHQILGRTVAVKILHRKFHGDAALLRRFMNEARAVGSLRHPHIVESYDVAMTPDGTPFLVLEFLDGHSLSAELRAVGAFSAERAIRIAVQVASALSAAHGRGIVHRDVKPGNILLLGGDFAKVLDFGISKLGEQEFIDTAAGSILGSPNYMAPEQITDPSHVDARADVYSLGAVLYEMLAGKPPFAGVPFPKILRMVRDEEPAPLESLAPAVDEAVVAVVRKAMAKDRDARYASADAFAADLQACFGVVSGVVTSPWAHMGDARHSPRPPAPGPTTSAPPPPAGLWWREWRVPIAIGLAVAVLVVALAVWFATLPARRGFPASGRSDVSPAPAPATERAPLREAAASSRPMREPPRALKTGKTASGRPVTEEPAF